MNRKDQLRLVADRRMAIFFKSSSNISAHVRPTRVLDKIVGALDPNFTMLNHFESENKRNPFALLVAVGGLWFLAWQLSRNERPTKSATLQGLRSRRLPRITLKGEEDGNINDSKQH